MAKTTGRAKKTETFTTRLEPRAKYVLELLARVSGRSIAKTLEEGIRAQAASTTIEIPGRPELSQSLDSVMDVLWSPQEWHRIIALAAVSPHLLSHLEECKLALLTQSRALCEPPVYGKIRNIVSIEVIPGLVESAWPIIEERAQLMAEQKPARPPTIQDIEAAHGEPLNLTMEADGMMLRFDVSAF